jgi:hypothetical protein
MIVAILATALVLRVAAAFFWQQLADAEGRLFRFGDSETYWILAEKLADGQPYDYAGVDSRIFRAPLYPLFLVPAASWNGRAGVMTARLSGAILGTVVVGILMRAAYQLAGMVASLATGILATVYPGAIGMSIFVLSEAIFCPLMMLSLLAWRAGESERGWWPGRAMLAGAIGGLACLARPSWLLWPGLLAAGILCREVGFRLRRVLGGEPRLPAWQGREPRPWSELCYFSLGMILAMSPWWCRNYLVTGRFVPTTLQVGASLYDGLHEGATGSSDEGMAFSLPFEIALRAEERQATRIEGSRAVNASKKNEGDVFEWKLNRALFWAAIHWANENRSAACRLALIKFRKMWSPWPTAEELGGVGIRIAESLVYVIILLLAVIGLWTSRGKRAGIAIYVYPTLYFAALHLVFVGSVRYRQPAVLALCVVAGIGSAWMLRQIRVTLRVFKTLQR